MSDASGILDGLTRMFCEAGVPKVLLCDEDSAVVKALREVEVDIRNLEHQLVTEHGTSFKIVPVSGHNMNGLVERAIRTIQHTLEESGLKKTHLTATGLQTICKLVENQCNNLPLGFKRSRDADNSELFRILTPNMLRHGRNNSRSVEGPVRLPGSLSEMAQRVTDVYQAWFKIWSTVAVPKLAKRTKWFKPDRNLEVGDIIYFQKDSSGLSPTWTTGMVDETVEGDDDLVREVVIRYRNSSEEFDRFTNRAARSCVRLHNMDDNNLADDLHELIQRLSMVQGGEHLVGLLDAEFDDISNQDEYSSAQTELDSNQHQLSPAFHVTNLISSFESVSTPDDITSAEDLSSYSQATGSSSTTASLSIKAILLATAQTPAPAYLKEDLTSPNVPSLHTQLTGSTPAILTAHFHLPNLTHSATLSNPAHLLIPNSFSGSLHHPLLTPRSRSPVGQSREDEHTVATALLTQSIQTPVIVCDDSSQHIPQAQSCLDDTPQRNLDPIQPAKCKKCCCLSHHKLSEHKLHKGAPPPLACDLADFKLTFCDGEVGLKGDTEFDSFNQMIWSCELNLNK